MGLRFEGLLDCALLLGFPGWFGVFWGVYVCCSLVVWFAARFWFCVRM